jgi:amidase
MVPMASASDIGGSIRIPAGCCGVFGLKPSRGRNPLAPFPGEGIGFLQAHAITRSVRDSAALLDATCDGGPKGFLDAARAPAENLRVAVSTQPVFASDIHGDCTAAVRNVGALLEDLGHHVDDKDPPVDATEFQRAYFVMSFHNIARYLHELEALLGSRLSRPDMELRSLIGWFIGKKLAPKNIDAAQATLQRQSADMARFFESYDVLLTPTVARPPAPHAALVPKGLMMAIGSFCARKNLEWMFSGNPAHFLPGAKVDPTIRFMCFTPLANALGLPSMNAPLVWNDEGLPVGTTFTGRRDEESTLFRLAAQLERARPWDPQLTPG